MDQEGMLKMLYPLRFDPLFRQYIWGGRRLATILDKPIGNSEDYAESWEIVDHGKDQSVVRYGACAGKTLHELVTRYGEQLFGRHHPQAQFPLLFKLLDANRNLSVQVHPNDLQAAQLEPPDLGKTEAWVILDTRPGSQLFAGLRDGVDRGALLQAVREGSTEACLHAIEPEVGDCIFIPAGTVHALGAGLLVAEIQQASDTTYRLFDWNRLGADGSHRALHVDQAMQVIDFDKGPVPIQQPRETRDAHVEQLVACDKFELNRWTLQSPRSLPDDGGCRLLAVLSGCLEVSQDPAERPLRRGETILVPAIVPGLRVVPQGETVFLEMCLP